MTPRRALLVFVGLIVFAVAYVGVRSYRAAAAAADYSCLASLHDNLTRHGVFDRASGGAGWKEWTDAEVALALSLAEPTDCADRAWWKDDIAIRTRRVQAGVVESYMWRKSDPGVNSGPNEAVQQ